VAVKRWIRLGANLYPKAWRIRYGAEFEALLDDVGVSARIVLDVVKGAILMQVRQRQKIGTAALFAAIVVLAGSWWAGERPYITPGAHQVFRMDSTPGALLEFLVLMIMAPVGLGALASARARWLFAGIAASYLAAILAVSLLTPRTIVSIGDSYCWDLWCVGIQNVKTTPQGENVLYTAEVSMFADTDRPQHIPAEQAKQFFYAVNEQGRRFPIIRDSSLVNADVTINSGESVKSSLAFLAPANARKLYLTGDIKAPLWVRLYFASDLNPFHRRTLLRVI
jgi:hypothetical protein